MKIIIEPQLQKFKIFLGIGVVNDIRNQYYPGELWNSINNFIQDFRKKYNLDFIKDHPHIRKFRDFYWRLGIDPTKQRPAHEALVRRILHGQNLPKINPIVDIGNLISIKYLLPIGIYDFDKLDKSKDLVLRFANEGEEFYPIGSGKKKLSSNQVVLAQNNLIVHVFPYRDSEITKVTENTKNILIIVGGIELIEEKQVLNAVKEIEEMIIKYLGGEVRLNPVVIRNEIELNL